MTAGISRLAAKLLRGAAERIAATQQPKGLDPLLRIDNRAKVERCGLEGRVTVGEGCWIHDATLAGGEIQVGRFTSINGPNTRIWAKVNPVTVGSFCSIASEVSFFEFGHPFDQCTTYFIQSHVFGESGADEFKSRGPIRVGSDVWIGTQCVVLSGSEIGHGAVIGANSVVNGQIPPFGIAVGSPARVMRFRFEPALIELLLRLSWWDWPLERLRKNRSLFRGALTLEKLHAVV